MNHLLIMEREFERFIRNYSTLCQMMINSHLLPSRWINRYYIASYRMALVQHNSIRIQFNVKSIVKGPNQVKTICMSSPYLTTQVHYGSNVCWVCDYYPPIAALRVSWEEMIFTPHTKNHNCKQFNWYPNVLDNVVRWVI